MYFCSLFVQIKSRRKLLGRVSLSQSACTWVCDFLPFAAFFTRQLFSADSASGVFSSSRNWFAPSVAAGSIHRVCSRESALGVVVFVLSLLIDCVSDWVCACERVSDCLRIYLSQYLLVCQTHNQKMRATHFNAHAKQQKYSSSHLS